MTTRTFIGTGWTILRTLLWIITGLIGLFTVIGLIITLTGAPEQRTGGIIAVALFTVTTLLFAWLTLTLRPRRTTASAHGSGAGQTVAAPNSPVTVPISAAPVPVAAPSAPATARVDPTRPTVADATPAPTTAAASDAATAVPVSRRELRARADTARSATPAAHAPDSADTSWHQFALTRPRALPDERGEVVVQVVYADRRWQPESSAYSFLWALRGEPYVGQRVFVPGSDGPKCNGIVAGFGRTGYRGALKKVAGVARAQVTGPAKDAAKARAKGEQPLPVSSFQVRAVRPAGDAKVVGEKHHQAAWDYLDALGVQSFPVVLWPEPENKFGNSAVRVDALLDETLMSSGSTLNLGYVASEDSQQLFDLLAPLRENGVLTVARAKFWHGDRSPVRHIYTAIDQDATSLLQLFPPEAPDGTGIVWSADRSVVATGEEKHQDILSAQGEGAALFQLQVGTLSKGKYAGAETIDVLLDGSPVGQLTKLQAERYLPRLHSDVDTGRTVWATGEVIDEGARGYQVSLAFPYYEGE